METISQKTGLKSIDLKAFAAAFQKVQVENEGTELFIQSIENKGDGVVVVKVKVSDEANKEKIHSDLMQNYELALKAIEEKYPAALKAKDEEIAAHRQENAYLRQLAEKLAKTPIAINLNQEDEQT